MILETKSVDWELLRQQKLTLLRVLSAYLGYPEEGALTGILNLVDCLQDLAAEELGAEAVFGTGDES